jgi:hypothetical protein
MTNRTSPDGTDSFVTDLLERLSPTDLLRIEPLSVAKGRAGCSIDTLKRHHADKIVRLSPRRLGMRMGHSLMIAQQTKVAR